MTNTWHIMITQRTLKEVCIFILLKILWIYINFIVNWWAILNTNNSNDEIHARMYRTGSSVTHDRKMKCFCLWCVLILNRLCYFWHFFFTLLIDWWRWQYNRKWRRPSVIHTNSLICWANSLKEFIICFFFSLIFFFSIACEFFMSKLRYFLIYTVWKIYATHLTQFENKFTFTIIIAHETRINPIFIECKRKFYIILLKMQCTL